SRRCGQLLPSRRGDASGCRRRGRSGRRRLRVAVGSVHQGAAGSRASAPPRASDVRTPVIELDGVSKTFSTRHGAAKALQDLSLVIGESETLGLIGESGSGKSTLGRVTLG